MSSPRIVIPTAFTAGDSFAASLAGAAAYAGADGWIASLRLIGADANRAVAGADAGGGAWTFAADATSTSMWMPGSYSTVAVLARGAERISIPGPGIVVRPNPASATDIRSDARRALDDLMAAYRSYLATGKLMMSYSIGSRSIQFLTIGDLLRAIDIAKRDVAAEEIALGIAPAGAAGRYVVRM